MGGELSIAPPFNLGLSLRFDQGHRWRPDTKDPGWYTSVLHRQFVRIRQEKEHGPLEFEPDTEQVSSKLLWQFRSGDDVQAVYDKLARDHKMASLLERYQGLRIMQVDLWECLVFFILSAHNHYQLRVPTATGTIRMDIIAEALWQDGDWTHPIFPFPSAEEILFDIGIAKLDELWSGETSKDRRIHGPRETPMLIWKAASFVEAGNLEKLRRESTEVLVPLLTRLLSGVGPKTAQCVALFGMGRLDAFPQSTQVNDALLSLYGRDPFGPCSGYASLLLFMEGLANPSRWKEAQVQNARRPLFEFP